MCVYDLISSYEYNIQPYETLDQWFS